jgi:2-methylcitrate dehydratase PrpD
VTGRLDLDSHTPELLADPAVRRLAEKVEVREDSSLAPAFPAGRPSRVEVVLRDGTVRTASIGIPRGNHGNPVSDAVVLAKAGDLLRRAAGPRWAGEVKRLILDLDRRASLGKLSRLLGV